MVTKKVLLTSILATLCLFSILFMAFPTRSSSEEYDPWADVSGPTIGEPDGTINMRDIQYEILHFNTYGTPVNRTALLEAQSQIENLTTLILELQSRMDSLNATVIEQQDTINNLNQTIVYLNETVTILNSTALGAPDYDSGWQSMGSVIYLTHNLNTTDVIVYLMGKYVSGNEWIHQYIYGGSGEDPVYLINAFGAWWAASNTTINLYRGSIDSTSGMPWQYVRVLIWKIPQP